MLKKGEMGVGTLIVFIAMLLVAAVAAGVLIQTAGSLQEKSLATGDRAKDEIATNARVIEVSAIDGQDGSVEDISIIYKLSPGSEPIKLDNVLFTESTQNTTNNLKVREYALPVNDVFQGYYTASYLPKPYRITPFEDAVPQGFNQVFGASDTSAMMIGKIAVAIIFVESNGAVDVNYENWTTMEEDAAIAATQDALNWWSAIEPRAGIRQAYEIHRSVRISYEPITRDTSFNNQTLWITEALDAIGAPAGGDIFTRLDAHNNELRDRLHAHWAFTAFIVDSSHTPGGFADGYAGIAYINGPHTFIANNAYGEAGRPALFAHEFGHIFGARDEYASSNCSCDDMGGYFHIATENCDTPGCQLNVSSIMRGGADTISAYNNNQVDLYTLGQLGLLDATGNDLLDPIDILFERDDDGAQMTNATIQSLIGEYRNPSTNRISGFFSKQYMQEGTNHKDNNIQRGDIVKFEFEASRPITMDEEVRLDFIPKIGSSTKTVFVTPDVMSVERVYLYP